MKVHVMTGASRLREFQSFARRSADAGFAGLVITESGRTAYLACAAAALSGADLDLATGVAVAFPRSPMVTASTAWVALAGESGGRAAVPLMDPMAEEKSVSGWERQIEPMLRYLRSQQFTEQNGWRREDPAYGAWGMGGVPRIFTCASLPHFLQWPASSRPTVLALRP